MTVPEPAPPIDRRRLRAEQGRERVVGALLEFFDEGESQPGAARIAERAGVSERSVFRYFDDLDALAAEAVERQIERMRHVYAAPDSSGPLAVRVDALVDARLRLHDAVAVASAAGRRIEARAEAIARAFAFRRRLLRRQVADQFAPELAALDAPTRAEMLDALDAAASFDHIDQLLAVAGHSRTRVRAITRRTLLALLAS